MVNDEDNKVFSSNNARGDRPIVAQFDLASGEVVHSLAWSPDSKKLIVTSQQGSIGTIYDVVPMRHGPIIDISDHRVQTTGLILNDDGSFIAPKSSISSNKSAETSVLTRFDRYGKSIGPVLTNINLKDIADINILKMSSTIDGELVAILGVDTTAKTRGLSLSGQWPAMIISLNPERMVVSPENIFLNKLEIARDVSVASKEKLVSILSNMGEVKIWSKNLNKYIYTVKVCESRSVECDTAKISNDGVYLLTNGSNIAFGSSKAPVIWSVKSNKPFAQLAENGRASANKIERAAWSPDSAEVTFADTGQISTWAVKGDKVSLVFNREMPHREDGRVAYSPGAIAYSQDRKLAISAGNHVIIYK